jgi:single-stranded-DNA-specific exonuclease
MKYQLINKDVMGKSLLDIVFENRNLTKEQVERLLKCNSNEYRNPFEIFNMDKAVSLFKEIYKEDLVIGILPDEDVDGFTSSSLLYQFLINDLNHPIENIRVFFHKKRKTHGLGTSIFNDMLNSDVDLWLIADSSSNDFEQQKQLANKGMNVIILDHHIIENYQEIENVIIVNNQLEDLSNSNLAGVGVVAQWIRALEYSIDKYVDLIAIGLVADATSMIDNQNRAYVNEG